MTVSLRRSLLIICTFVLLKFSISSEAWIRAPCVFRSDEVDMHKYSAVLAATEPFRRQCDKQIMKSLNPFQILLFKLKGKPIFNSALSLREVNRGVDLACSRYESRVENTLRSYGMNIEDFNEISLLVAKHNKLKKRVLLQSFYYKITADLQANLRPALPMLPNIGPVTSPVKIIPAEDDQYSNEFASQLTRFCRALRSIERERLRIRNHLKQELHIQELPSRISDPEVQPALCSPIQQASKEFPKLATKIIKKHGLHVEEFNNLQDKVSKNVVFRFFVQREIKQIERETRKKI